MTNRNPELTKPQIVFATVMTTAILIYATCFSTYVDKKTNEYKLTLEERAK